MLEPPPAITPRMMPRMFTSPSCPPRITSRSQFVRRCSSRWGATARAAPSVVVRMARPNRLPSTLRRSGFSTSIGHSPPGARPRPGWDPDSTEPVTGDIEPYRRMPWRAASVNGEAIATAEGPEREYADGSGGRTGGIVSGRSLGGSSTGGGSPRRHVPFTRARTDPTRVRCFQSAGVGWRHLAVRLRVPDRGRVRDRARCIGTADTGRRHRSVRLGARGSVRSPAPPLARDVLALPPFGDGRYRHAPAGAFMARFPPRLPRGMDADPRPADVWCVAAMARAIAAGAHDELRGDGPDREHVHLPRAAPCRDRVRIRDDSIDLRARGSRS